MRERREFRGQQWAPSSADLEQHEREPCGVAEEGQALLLATLDLITLPGLANIPGRHVV